MQEQALMGVLPPALITLLFLAAAWRPWKKSGWPKGDWGSALGVALGYIAADELVRNVWQLWPNGGNMHPHIALLAAAFVIAANHARLATFRSVLAVVVTVGACALVMRSPLRNDREVAIKVVGIASAAGLAMWSACSMGAKASGGARVPLMLWAAASGNAVVLLQNQQAALAQMSGALAACMGGFVLLGWWRPLLPAVRGAIPVYVLVMLGLLIVGRDFQNAWEPHHRSIALAACAVASPIITVLPPFKKLRPWQGTLACVLITIAICIGAVALSRSKFDFSGLD